MFNFPRKSNGRTQHSLPADENLVRRQRVRNAITRFDFDVEDYISVGLAGKIKIIEAKLAAIELGFLINSFAYRNGATVYERAVNRETGLRLAEHLAHIFFDNPDEEEIFMEGIRSYAENDIMLEMGYCFCEGRAFYPSALFHDYESSKAGGSYQWAETIAVFETHEKQVADTIREAVLSLTDEIIADKVALFIDKFNLIRNTTEDDIMSDLKRILEIQQIA